jgi:threonine synthase
VAPWRGILHHYRSRLPVGPATPDITLFEGNTPLLPAPNFAHAIGAAIELYVKYEAVNPTGSFKDRGMAVAISKAVERRAEVVLCASTGNTAASAAAYAARAGLPCFVLLPSGGAAAGKLAQALMHGARVAAVDDTFDQALKLVRELCWDYPEIELVNSVNPTRLEGQKTAAFEICDTLGRAPDLHFLPVGNAGNIAAYWKGYSEYFKDGLIQELPKLFGIQAAGAAPLVEGRPVLDPKTIASAIRIGCPFAWEGATRAVRESGGRLDKVSDEEILEAYELIARREGIFVEPASAAALAGLRKAWHEGTIPEGSLVVATLTGHGLKDPQTAVACAKCKPVQVEASKESLLGLLGF